MIRSSRLTLAIVAALAAAPSAATAQQTDTPVAQSTSAATSVSAAADAAATDLDAVQVVGALRKTANEITIAPNVGSQH